jgi:beta-lactamase regulating signal transducer with metallopeptidase domain
MSVPFDSILLTALWRASWQGALAICVVAALCAADRRVLSANVRCWLWRLALLRLVVGFAYAGSVAVPLLHPLPPSAIPSALVATAAAPAQPEPNIALPTMASTVAAPVVAPQGASDGRQDSRGGDGAATDSIVRATEQPAVSPLARGVDPYAVTGEILLLLYAAGVLVGVVRSARSVIRTRLLLATALPAGAAETALLAEIARSAGLRHVPRLGRTDAITSPLYAGDAILLPVDAPIAPSDLRLVLAHEAAHARRRDLLWEAVGLATQTLFFFHPLVHVGRREERLARESAADALALKITNAAPADYGRLLLAVAVAPRTRATSLLALGAAESGPLLRRRLTALADAVSPAPRRLRLVAAALLPAAVALALLPLRVSQAGGSEPADGAQPDGVSAIVGLSRLVATSWDADQRQLREGLQAAPPYPGGNQSIVLTLRDDAGRPVSDVSAQLFWSWNASGRPGIAVCRTGISDAAGSVTMSGLSSGRYLVMVGSRQNRFVAFRRNVTLDPGQHALVVPVAVTTGALVIGRVVDSLTGRTPVARTMIYASIVNLAQNSFVAHVAADGEYQVRVPPGHVVLRLFANDRRTYDRGVVLTTADVIARYGQTVHAPDLLLERNPGITFVGPDGKAVTDLDVTLRPAPGPSVHATEQDALTNANGLLALRQVYEGTYWAEKGGLVASGSFNWQPNHALTVVENGQTRTFPDGVGTAHLTARPPAAVTGRVVDPSGAPLAGATVTVIEQTDEREFGHRTYATDASGRFRVPTRLGGKYLVYIHLAGYNRVDALNGAMFAPRDGETRNVGTLTLVPATGDLSGRVVDAGGRAAPGMLVAVTGAKTLDSATMTDANGDFHVAGLVPGEPLTVCVAPGTITGDGPRFIGVLIAGSPGHYGMWYRTGVRAGMTGVAIRMDPSEINKQIDIRSTNGH